MNRFVLACYVHICCHISLKSHRNGEKVEIHEKKVCETETCETRDTFVCRQIGTFLKLKLNERYICI